MTFSEDTSMLGGGILLYRSAMLTAVDLSASSGQSHGLGEGASFFCDSAVCEDSL